MKRVVLLVTASLELGQLISESLSETCQFDVYHCREEESAVAFLQTHRDCGHVLIENALGETRVIELCRALRRIKNSLKLILISRGQPSADVDQIRPWSLLRQPFVLPELLAALDAVPPTIIDGEAIETSVPRQPSWLDDPDVAVKTLQHLVGAPNIEEVILLRKSDVWACAGNLSPVTVSKIKNVVLSNLNSEQDFDLLRYMRLGDREDQHGLWAKLLLVNVILAVIYDLTTSFSEMRRQTNMLAEALARPVLPPAHEEKGYSLAANIQSRRTRGWKSRMSLLSTSPDLAQPHLLNTVPAKDEVAEPFRLPEPRFYGHEAPLGGSSVEKQMYRSSRIAAIGRAEFDSFTRDSVSLPAKSNGSKRRTSRSLARSEALIAPEAESFNVPGIPYSCLLTPRFQTHPLTGDLAELVRSTLPQVCIAYGWRLEFMEVMEDCLHWVAVLPPTEPVADHIQRIRHLTSGQIWEICPEYLRENFSKDFWAPGYSILAGPQRHSQQQIRDYVLNYRGPQYRYDRGPTLDFDPSAETTLD